MSSNILIIHDRFQFKGGAERLVLILAKALKADIMTEFWTDESFEYSEGYCRDAINRVSKDKRDAINGVSTESNDNRNKNKLYLLDRGEAPWIVWRYFRAHYNFLFKTRKIVRQYDLIIFSGNNCLTASFNCRRQTKKILYCHSPVRHVFDLWQFARAEQTKRWKKLIYYDIGAWGIRLIYWLGLKNMDKIIANSQTIKGRLKNFIHQKTDEVIYPPIETNKFKWLSQGDYYLSFGRLERLKRIPDIITAFQKMPSKKLIAVSGGPDLEKVKRMAENYPNIKVVGWVSDEELTDYIGRCIATIYLPINEDFGMTPLEGMAAGKPCLGVFDGGLKETIIDEKTGKFVPVNYTIDDIVKAVEWLTPEQALVMREECEKQAARFSEEKFVREIKELIKYQASNYKLQTNSNNPNSKF